MDIIEELKYYCSITNPVGALMLSGEWGCGKTYLIKNTFIPAVKDEYVVLCISLFGLDSIDAIKQEVKKQWLEKAGEIIPQDGARVLSKAADGYKKLFAVVKGILPEKLQDGGEAISSVIDLVKYMPVTNTMYEKKVILVFDDLERSNIPSPDLLGCINDYCENQHFNVIMVANEDKIKENKREDSSSAKSGDTSLSYDDIKEKIVQRVIRFVPDYGEVVDNCIEALGESEYTDFLKDNKNSLVKILAGDFDDNKTIEKIRRDFRGQREEREKVASNTENLLRKRPHNIRSFKCAIQDFERVYNLLDAVGVKERSNWLTSFTCCMMMSKAGMPIKKKYGVPPSDSNQEKLYPGLYNPKYVPNGVLLWIDQGVWSQEAIEEEVKLSFGQKIAKTPVDILKTCNLLDVEDEIISQGFNELLNLAYSGSLSLNEYVVFIQNSACARHYGVDIPSIDWQKIKAGITLKLEEIISSDEDTDSHYYESIDVDNEKDYSEDELSAYRMIKDFRIEKVAMYERNRREYITMLSGNRPLALVELGSKRYNALTSEMVEATYNAFETANNEDKGTFSGWFDGIWSSYRIMMSSDACIKCTEQSLKELRAKLKNLEKDYEEKKKRIAVYHTSRFIDGINAILGDRDDVTEQSKKEQE